MIAPRLKKGSLHQLYEVPFDMKHPVYQPPLSNDLSLKKFVCIRFYLSDVTRFWQPLGTCHTKE